MLFIQFAMAFSLVQGGKKNRVEKQISKHCRKGFEKGELHLQEMRMQAPSTLGLSSALGTWVSLTGRELVVLAMVRRCRSRTVGSAKDGEDPDKKDS